MSTDREEIARSVFGLPPLAPSATPDAEQAAAEARARAVFGVAPGDEIRHAPTAPTAEEPEEDVAEPEPEDDGVTLADVIREARAMRQRAEPAESAEERRAREWAEFERGSVERLGSLARAAGNADRLRTREKEEQARARETELMNDISPTPIGWHRLNDLSEAFQGIVPPNRPRRGRSPYGE